MGKRLPIAIRLTVDVTSRACPPRTLDGGGYFDAVPTSTEQVSNHL